MTTVALQRAPWQQGATMVAQLVVLAVLSATVGLGVAGWASGLVYAVGLWVLLTIAVRRYRVTTLGPAGLVTCTRGVLIGAVTALVADGLAHGSVPVALLVGTVTVALVLDAVDGRVARRTGTASALGARFDMELDAFLILVLSVHVAGLLGAWVLAIGGMRYAFVAVVVTVGRSVGWMRSTVPARKSARVVAAVQGIVLATVSSGLLPHGVGVALVATALAMLTWSFSRDVQWLRHARREPATVAAEPATVADEAVTAADEPATTTDDPATAAPGRWTGRPGVHRVTAVLAGLLVFLALLVPQSISEIHPAAFARIPVEALVGIVVALLLPSRALRPVAVAGGLLLGLLTVVKIANAGFMLALARPFHPLTDWALLDDAVGFLRTSIGPAYTVTVVIAAVVLLIAAVVVTGLAALRLSRLVIAHRGAATRTVAVLAPVWLACALLGAHLVPGSRSPPGAPRRWPTSWVHKPAPMPGTARRSLPRSVPAPPATPPPPPTSRACAARMSSWCSWRATAAARSRTPRSRRRWMPCSTRAPGGSGRPGSAPAAAGSPRRPPGVAAGWPTRRC